MENVVTNHPSSISLVQEEEAIPVLISMHWPSHRIKRIEILRDGASAQYGSDAIAGVINVILEDRADGFTGVLLYGAYSTDVVKGMKNKLVMCCIISRAKIESTEKTPASMVTPGSWI
jgi:outer membrane receptor for ferrienterochelin and colicin